MSVALPRIVHVGHVHPDVLTAAKFISQHGWRVTSIYRPHGVTHPKGIALDMAPMTYVMGGFGPLTARLIHQYLKAAVPSAYWLVVAEADHIHANLAKRDAVGINTIHGTVIL